MRPLIVAVLLVLAQHCYAVTPADLGDLFRAQVARRLDVPPEVERRYIRKATDMLAEKGADLGREQLLVVVDRNPHIQALLLFAGSQSAGWQLIGASPVSTGQKNHFDNYITPTGVFDHNPVGFSDYRAEGTLNSNGIRGYGKRGMRVWDFGWTQATRGWGRPERSAIRLQMHATDPDRLESRLGTTASKGCIRLSGSLNAYLDVIGALDWHLEQAARTGTKPWVLRSDRLVSDLAGRYLVVLESDDVQRPTWASLPRAPQPVRAKAAAPRSVEPARNGADGLPGRRPATPPAPEAPSADSDASASAKA